mgnify:CR=1 FL=1
MKNLFGKVIGSVGVKIGIIMVALGGTTAAAILISSTLISAINVEVESLVENHLPPLESSMQIADSVIAFKDATNSLIMSYSMIGFAEHEANLNQAAESLKKSAEAISREEHPELNAILDDLLEDTQELINQKRTDLISNCCPHSID